MEPAEPPLISEPRRRFPWVPFLLVIFVPTVLTVLSVQLGFKEALPFVCALPGGGISGVIGGILVGRYLGKTEGSRIALSIVAVPILAVACVTMNCIGCTAGGYKMDFR